LVSVDIVSVGREFVEIGVGRKCIHHETLKATLTLQDAFPWAELDLGWQRSKSDADGPTLGHRRGRREDNWVQENLIDR